MCLKYRATMLEKRLNLSRSLFESERLSPNAFAYLLMIPAALVMFGVVVYPFFYNVVLSFSNMSLRHFRDWHLIGFKQYA